MLGEKVSKEELCQISLTGVRSLLLLMLLIKEPQSLEDIRKVFIQYNIMDSSNSNDIIRIDINTLRKMGCTISRADHRTNNKFVLINHPFKIDITQEEVDLVKRAFNRIKENADIDVLLLYNDLFKKIAPHIANDDVKESLLGISPLKKYSLDIIDELKSACENKNLVKLIYKAPTVSKESEKEIYADKIALQSDKLYLYGVDKNSNQPIYLNLKRILKIISKEKSNEKHTVKPITVKFLLNEFGFSGLNDDEKIISGDTENGYVICGEYHNKFIAIQRILSFGSKCTILEPNDFKDEVIQILKRMRDVYNA